MEQNTMKINDIVEDVNLNLIKSRRDSGIELFRIISMIIVEVLSKLEYRGYDSAKYRRRTIGNKIQGRL